MRGLGLGFGAGFGAGFGVGLEAVGTGAGFAGGLGVEVGAAGFGGFGGGFPRFMELGSPEVGVPIPGFPPPCPPEGAAGVV